MIPPQMNSFYPSYPQLCSLPSKNQHILQFNSVYNIHMGAECEVRYKEVRYAEGGAVW